MRSTGSCPEPRPAGRGLSRSAHPCRSALVEELCGPGYKLDGRPAAAPAEWTAGIGRNLRGGDELRLRYENLAAPGRRGSGLPPPPEAKAQLDAGRARTAGGGEVIFMAPCLCSTENP